MHPSGRPYVLRRGGFDSIATISPDERAALFTLARSFDEMPLVESTPPPMPQSDGGTRPGDDYAARTSWSALLTGYGWTNVFQNGETTYWRRPGKSQGISATTNHGGSDLLYVFSTSTSLPSEVGVGKFAAYAHLEHGGDFKAAAKALAGAGFGSERSQIDSAVLEGEGQGDDTTVPELDVLLDDVVLFVNRFVHFTHRSQALVVGLWVALIWTFAQFDVAPYLAVTSAEKRSGKSRLLDVLELLVRRPWRLVTPSEAVLFRRIAEQTPTLLLDEMDAVYGPKSAGQYEGVRALLNASHRRETTVPRCVGDGAKITVVDFPVYCPKAFAGIGNMPDTVADRSIPVRLSRRRSGERVERFRYREVSKEAEPIQAALSTWAATIDFTGVFPALPDELDDRALDCWEPLLAIADLAGEEWGAKARAAALYLSAGRADDDQSLGVRLLADLHTIHLENSTVDGMTTAVLLEKLKQIEESPWADFELTPRKLAAKLAPYGVTRRQHRFGEKNTKGYLWADLEDPWERYLNPPTPSETAPTRSSKANAAPDSYVARR